MKQVDQVMEQARAVTASTAVIKLEFGEILRRLSTHCRFSVAAERAMEITPSRDRKIVTYLFDVTSEATDLLVQFPELTVGGARDIRDQIEKAVKGSRLLPHELLLVMDTIRAGRDLRKTFTRLPDVENRYSNLLEFAEAIENLSPLETDLNRSIGPRGDVLDAASPALGSVRKAVRVAHHRLMDRLNSFVSGGRFGSALQENLITIRDGRYVVPVRAEARNLIRGVVHDTSASGQTLFIEPFDVVELNNRWREQQLAEEREVERILDVLSARIGDEGDALDRIVEAIAALDLAMAKARLGASMSATRPKLHEPAHGAGRDTSSPAHHTHLIRLDNARHPLLPANGVVPISVELGHDFRVLLITGPNTGGKTVALKTIGLLTLMAQAGLYIPADDSSVVSVFSAVFVDIGDEQSIEQSLSTFSSHIRNIINMLGAVSTDSLVLLDEVGAGTDPQEGSALARALISDLLRRRAMVVATTHYSEVKAFAYATSGVENASVEFDMKSLAPTYRLMVGVPGYSNALSIAGRLGLSGEIVDEARRLLEPGDGRTEQLIDDIRQRRDYIARELADTKHAHEDVRILRRRAALAIREAEELRRTTREAAIADVEQELSEVRKSIREAGRHAASSGNRLAQSESVSLLREAEQQVRTVQRRNAPVTQPIEGLGTRRKITVGDKVKVVSLDMDGEVVSVAGNDAEIALGSLKLRQPLNDLQRIGRASQTGSSRQRLKPVVDETVPIEIDMRGYRVDEIASILEQYVHDAYLTGLPWVRIIHGKGTGALRQVVRDQLRENPVVSRNEAAPSNEGGEGATVAHLRQT